MRFLVTRTISFFDNDPWGPNVDVENEAGYVNSRVGRLPARLRRIGQRWYDLQFALRLLRLCRKYDGISVGRYGTWFPILQRILGLNKRVVMTDIEWMRPNRGRLARLAALSSSAVCCFTRAEIERYSKCFRIPAEKLIFVPLAFQLRDIWEPSSDDGYIFAGGNQGRDWQTFVDAVEGLTFPVEAYTGGKLPYLPRNTTVRYIGREDFYRRMAAASCVVVPLVRGPLPVRGNTVWTAAMAMGKVVIATEPDGAPDYMENGVSGFYVNHGDAKALRKCIVKVMDDPALRKRVGEAARERAWREFGPEVFRRRVLALLSGESA
jgi:glycosyltransferase involved in cell wall biosynthesis